MVSKATTPETYIENLPEDRKAIIQDLRRVIIDNLPSGFEEQINYGMLGYVVPHSKYPNGYHCDTSKPLPFINLASQKNSINLYHMGLYSDPILMQWFKNEYPNYCSNKLDMGKSCIRFKNIHKIPVELIGRLVSKMSAAQWINLYEKTIKK